MVYFPSQKMTQITLINYYNYCNWKNQVKRNSAVIFMSIYSQYFEKFCQNHKNLKIIICTKYYYSYIKFEKK